MTLVPTSRSARLLLLAVVCAGLVAGGFFWYEAERDPHGEVVTESSAREWKTIEYQGVQVDIPAAWEVVDMDGCEFQFEQWAPPNSAECGLDGGMAFYGSSTFDPSPGPGVRRNDSTDSPTWGGYAYAGDFAVHASDDDHDLVQRILNSAR